MWDIVVSNVKFAVSHSSREEDKKEGINRNSNVDWNDTDSDLNFYETLHDKWNEIQEAYFEKYQELEKEGLYFDSGGFEGLLEMISGIRGRSGEEIKIVD